MNQVWLFIQQHYRDAIEIAILWGLIYQAYLYFRATRAARILTGLLILLLALLAVSWGLQLQVIPWLISKLSIFLAIALVVLFQPELRRALAELGSQRLFFSLGSQPSELAEPIAEAVGKLANKRFGALIAIERRIELTDHVGTGVVMDSEITDELLLTLFHPKTALHDGGVVIRQDRLHAAACVFPVSQKENLERSLGLRHRAGIGLSEETDAVIVIVSEETGEISIAVNGALDQDIPRSELAERIAALLGSTTADAESEGETSSSEG